MTSTSINVGLDDNTRVSSRVLRPPGGGHTDIFGGEPEPPRTGRRMAPNPAVAAAAAAAAEEAAKPTSTETPENNGQAQHSPPRPQPATEPADNMAQTPDQSKTARQPPATDPPKRVRVPPGGFSSGLW